MIDRRAFVTALAAVAVAGLAPVLPALATPKRSVAPVRATRTGLLYDNRYCGFPEGADGGDLVFDIGQTSTWHYHPFPEDTEGVLRHVATGLTFLTVPVPRNEPPEVELLHLESVLAVDSSRLTMVGYAAQTCARTGFVESLRDRRRLLPHSQQAFYFRFLGEDPDDNEEDPQWTIRQPAPPLLATKGDRFEDLWIYPHERA
jgi:hypothetical protein